MATDRVDAVVIFGAAGDLAQLETFPAQNHLALHRRPDSHFLHDRNQRSVTNQ